MSNQSLSVSANKDVDATIVDKFDSSTLQNWHEQITDKKVPLLSYGRHVIVGFFTIISLWGCIAPLDGAVIGSGRIVAEDRNRVIEHLEGGILRQLNVREGDQVKAGDELVILDDVKSSSQLSANQLQLAIYQVQLARRRAEVNGLDIIEIPKQFLGNIEDEPRLLEAIESQKSEFAAQRRVLQAELEIIDNRIGAEKNDIEGNAAVLVAYDRQLDLFYRELADFKELLDKGLVKRTTVFATERRVAELEARIATTKLAVNQARNNIISLENQKKQTQLEYLKQANQLVVDLQQRLNEVESRVEQLADIMYRGRIVSPVDGTVFRIAKRTLGSVVAPGEPILEIFPDNDDLKLEVQLQVNDIEQVHIDQEVDVVFPSNRKNAMTPIGGKVLYLSADAVVSEANPNGAYIIHVQLDPNQTEQDIFAGNMAQVYFKTGSSTFFEYITEPVTRFAFKSFKG